MKKLSRCLFIFFAQRHQRCNITFGRGSLKFGGFVKKAVLLYTGKVKTKRGCPRARPITWNTGFSRSMDLESFIVSAVILLMVASVMVVLFKHLGLGSIAGLLVAGIIVGPHTPGPYITSHVEGVRSFTELGVVLLLFVIGLEMRPSRLWALRREIFGLGSLQILFAALAITGYSLFFTDSPWRASLVLGPSVPI